MSDNSIFERPEVKSGDRVLFWKDPSFGRPAIGFVLQPTPLGADIGLLGGGRIAAYHDCLYRNDPIIVTRPHLLEDADRGIFELAPAELELRTALKELAQQRDMLDQLAVQLGVKKFTEPPKRPGRPRKPPVEDAEKLPELEGKEVA